MRRGARDSQIVNNFFTLASIVMIAGTIAVYTKYFSSKEENKKNEITIQQLQCEKDSFTYSKVFNQTLLNKSIKALEKGYYKLDGGFIEAIHMKSKIKETITLKEVDDFYKTSIGMIPKKDIEKYLTIKYEIIENDKKNPNKINEDCKLGAGSVQTSFRINSKEIFRVYTDFAFLYKNAIKQRVDCSIKVFKNHVQNSTKHTVDNN